MIVVRHSAPGSPLYLSQILDIPVINAGDGAHEHPTQGLLDTFTMRERLGDLKGRRVVILGDLLFSRVARSNIQALTKFGADVTLVGPSTLVPESFAALGVKHEYVEVDLSTVGSLLDSGSLQAFIIYANAESATAPWITELSIGTDWAALNPTAEELAKLREAGFGSVEVSPDVFKKDVHADKVVLLPFYYGYHVGLEVPEEDVYKMLTTVEAKSGDLAQADASYAQVHKDMKGMQRRGVEASGDTVPVHPGLAKYMRERGVWDAAWDARVAQPK